MIDTNFDVYSDTPPGRDPDSHSPTLRRYHADLWSKPLPDGTPFVLVPDGRSRYLYHQSPRGEFVLASDAIGHTYRDIRSMAHVIDRTPAVQIAQFYRLCSTIGAYTLFPARMIDGKQNINQARGCNSHIRDRFDLTLECIRRHYHGEDSPLSDVLSRYEAFFALFETFKEYVRFFLLDDLVSDDLAQVRFFLPFDDFRGTPLPKDVDQYRDYLNAVSDFIGSRNDRISALVTSQTKE